QLIFARKQKSKAQAEMIFWSRKEEQFIGSLAMCNVILKKTKSEETSKKTKDA
ncbi:unnamed protein product, partial [marine sediment metagenome]